MSEERKITTIEMEIEEADTLSCGLRQEWISAECDGLTAKMNTGAGCGSPWLMFTLEENGGYRTFKVNMADVFQEFINKVRESNGNQPK